MFKKPPTGYEKKKKPKKLKTKWKYKHYLRDLIIPGKKKITFMERTIKFLIYIALRLVIKPSKWKNQDKNYELIDRIYKRIVGSDMVFIPSSIAFYIIMAFMPVLSLVIVLTQIPGIDGFFGDSDIKKILGKFIPGINVLIDSVVERLKSTDSIQKIGGLSGTVFIMILSTWIAAGGFAKLIYTQSFIYNHKFVGGWWMNKLKGMFLVVSLAIILITALFINILIERLIQSFNIAETAKNFLSYFFLVIGLFILVLFASTVLFKFSPRFHIKFREVISGAVVTALPTTLFLSLFAVFASLSSYAAYGIISIMMYVAIVSLWISNFIFIGIITNAAFYKTHISDTTNKKWTVSKK